MHPCCCGQYGCRHVNVAQRGARRGCRAPLTRHARVHRRLIDMEYNRRAAAAADDDDAPFEADIKFTPAEERADEVRELAAASQRQRRRWMRRPRRLTAGRRRAKDGGAVDAAVSVRRGGGDARRAWAR